MRIVLLIRIRKAKRKNAITGFTNIFRGKENKKQLIPVTTTKTEIKNISQ